ncbi:16S rRNA (adenine(1518)-N(6)/adenine(1519)-N(6))-dimethyltransferase RsmA [Candidatus Saccharibacteria bacterium]|nr:16S rRNA (adenine(1518)-N(6)/adenine(1519)-N(6))-dimethyltransferase RsmA [Candidatus Saccharibacteria bacterium]
MQPKKSLGQHWLKDIPTLEAICDAAQLKPDDVVIEVGPGLGDLTAQLLPRTGKLIAIELDEVLAKTLPQHISSVYKDGTRKLEVVQGDILKFDLGELPSGYKVVANIPYYLTSNLIRVLSESTNPPELIVLLVQKEVAERIAAKSGQMSLLSVSAQLFYETQLGPIVRAEMFEPPPKVDSQVIILDRRHEALFSNLDEKQFFKLVKAGFSGRRKKLRSSLAAGLSIDKPQADKLLKGAGINGDLRAQNLSLQDWYQLYTSMIKLY